MVESLRVLKVCRKAAVHAWQIALQIIQTTIVCAPDRLRDLLRNMTRMKLIRTLASWRPDLTGYRDVEEAYKIALKSLARRPEPQTPRSRQAGRLRRDQNAAAQKVPRHACQPRDPADRQLLSLMHPMDDSQKPYADHSIAPAAFCFGSRFTWLSPQ